MSKFWVGYFATISVFLVLGALIARKLEILDLVTFGAGCIMAGVVVAEFYGLSKERTLTEMMVRKIVQKVEVGDGK